MRYTKSELRNNRMPLLRRVQRQMDKITENKPIVLQEESDDCMILKSFTSTPSFESIAETKVPKKTKLHLYKKRGGR